jgi:signal transduction histidine kinase
VRLWNRHLGAGGDGGRWLVPVLLIIGVLAPTACVLWFMNAAIDNQRDASRRKLAEAYRGQLKLVRDRLESYWEQRAADLEREAHDGTAPAIFARVVERGLADSAVCLNRDGSAAYPALATPVAPDSTLDRPDWMAARTLESWTDPHIAAESYAAIARKEPDVSLAARAAQAQIRCLTRSGDKAAALRAIQDNFGGGRLVRGADATGRLIGADELLLVIGIECGAGRNPARRSAVCADCQSARSLPSCPTTADRLHDMVLDYSTSMPSAQRLFLMDELRAVAPGSDFPTYAAERLAARFLEAGRARTGEAALEASGVPDVWKLTAPGGRIVALYRAATAISAMRGLSSSSNVALALTPPGGAPVSADESLAAGSRLPGWQISLSFSGNGLVDEAARQRTISYVWIGWLAIIVVATTALAAGQSLRRQWRLARLKTDLLAAVSHELKTPLASMRLLVDALIEENKFEPEKTRDYLGLIGSENLRLSRLIENFLTFSRIERNRQSFEFAETRPEDVVRIAVHAMRERLQAPACQLEIDIAANLPALRADQDALVTTLLNLLDNAHKYTPSDRRIRLEVYPEADTVVFAVKDNGIGIAPRDQKRIFRRFYQVDRRLARETGGCGLGLSIVDFIVKAHGGSVRVESKPGAGSAFRIVMPTSSEAAVR